MALDKKVEEEANSFRGEKGGARERLGAVRQQIQGIEPPSFSLEKLFRSQSRTRDNLYH